MEVPLLLGGVCSAGRIQLIGVTDRSDDTVCAHILPLKKGLTAGALNTLLFQLDSDRDIAGERYLIIRRKLVKYFEWQRSPHPDEDADETLDRVARRLQEGTNVTDVQAYARGVARMVSLETIKKESKAQIALADFSRVVQTGPESESAGDGRLTQCLNQCLKDLSSSNRDLITRYYSVEKDSRIDLRASLAGEFGIPINALRIRVHRIIKKLEDCVRECLHQRERN